MLRGGSTQLLCLAAGSGVPLFTRGGGGGSRQLPFSVIGSLNGVHMFGGGQGAELSCSRTEAGGRVVWRVFQDSLMLMAVSRGEEEEDGGELLRLRRLLENAWGCMVLVLGLEELVRVRNVERLKRELRSCFSLLDELLEARPEGVPGALTHCVDSLLPPDAPLLQAAVDGFGRAVESEFCCLLVRGRVAAASEKWWRLAPREVVLLAAFIRSLSGSGAAASDHPVFLPEGSPTVAHRLLRFRLLPGVELCVLCGPTPSLQGAQAGLVGRFWAPLADTLRECLGLGGRCLPGSVALRPGVLALLLINRDSRRSLSCVQTPPPGSRLSGPRCWQLLRAFYVFGTSRYFGRDDAAEELAGSGDFLRGFSHRPQQCYLVTEECKSFGLQTPQHQMFLLCAPDVPTFSLRTVATQTLTDIVAATGF